ncbi:MAG: MoaD/ThiS family protein [Gemmatimonadaceae bacterium]
MAVTVTLPAVLARLADGSKELSSDGATVGQVVESLSRKFPSLASRIRDDAGQPYPFVVYYLNDEDIRLGDGFASVVNDGDELTLVPAIAGG